MSELDDFEEQAEEELIQVMRNGPTQEAKDAAVKAFQEIQAKHIRIAIAELEAGTGAFLSMIADLTAVIEKMGGVGGSAVRLKELRDRLSGMFGDFRSDKALPNSSDNDADAKQPTTDEASEQPTKQGVPVKSAAQGQPKIANPRPVNSREYANLADEYVRFFVGADYKDNAAKASAVKFAQTASANKARYEAVGGGLGGIPWWFIGGIHLLESSFRFDGHFHNGDPLVARTIRVPKNRPEAPPASGGRYTWEESAIDALKLKKFHQQSDWSLPRALFRWEQYNGFGYRKKLVPSPYLWSFSTIYSRGKFVRDGAFDSNAVSKQCGAATLLKALLDANQVDLRLDFFDEKVESGMESDFNSHAAKVEANQQPTVDGPMPANTPFEQFVADAIAKGRLPNLRHFMPGDFLVKGGQNATLNKNTDPPRELWDNAIGLMRVVDEFRQQIGHPVVINSAYRSSEYNRLVGGVPGSQHVKFQAADIKVRGFGNPGIWAQKLKEMRSQNFFRGGIGVYNTFVHVDTRGWDANW